MNKTEICVPIRNEEELRQAKDMLEKNGEDIWNNQFTRLLLNFNKQRYLMFDNLQKIWWLCSNINQRKEIPLSELESILKGENVILTNEEIQESFERADEKYNKLVGKNMDSKKRSSIEWNCINEKGMPNHMNPVLICNSKNEDTPITLGIQINNTEFYVIELLQNSGQVTHWMELPEKPNKP